MLQEITFFALRIKMHISFPPSFTLSLFAPVFYTSSANTLSLELSLLGDHSCFRTWSWDWPDFVVLRWAILAHPLCTHTSPHRGRWMYIRCPVRMAILWWRLWAFDASTYFQIMEGHGRWASKCTYLSAPSLIVSFHSFVFWCTCV
jgi:hypothetical protein